MSGLIILLWFLVVILFLIIALYVINETNFLYSEPKEYLNPDLSKIVHKEALPIFHLGSSENAIMLIHGFSGNPKELFYYSTLFIKDGFDVITPLQPGAGTLKEDFKKSYFSQWYKSIRDSYIKYRKNYKRFFVIGQSMGGSLALKLTEEFSDNPSLSPTAIVTMSAPVFLNSLFENGVLHNPILYFSRIGSWFVDELPATRKKTSEDGWDIPLGYEGLFTKQVHSLKMGLKPIKRNLWKVNVPIFSVQAKGDRTVPYENLLYISKNVSSKRVKIKIYDMSEFNHSKHTLCVFYSTKDDIFNEIKFFINQFMN